MHAFQSVATPFSSKDWADGVGTCEQHFERMKTVEKEVIGTIKINAIFLLLHMLPLAYLGKISLLVFYKLCNARNPALEYTLHSISSCGFTSKV